MAKMRGCTWETENDALTLVNRGADGVSIVDSYDDELVFLEGDLPEIPTVLREMADVIEKWAEERDE